MIRFMHSAVGRILRFVIGVLFVGLAAYASVLISTALLIVGTTMAVFAIANVCVADWFGAKQGTGGPRASHA